MKALLLCAGYGTRLAKDLSEESNKEFSHLKGIPKPLLPVAGKPLVTHGIQILDKIKVEEIVVVVNNLYLNQFQVLYEP